MNRPGQSLLSRLNFSRSQRRTQANTSRLGTETLLSLLSQLSSGHLKMVLPDGNIREFGNKSDDLQAEIQILDWSVFKQMLSHGDIGFAESYIRGEWNTPDLKAILELAIRNRTILEKAIYGSWYGSILYRLRHWLRDNSKTGSRKNIHAHYDLGNTFYTLWLDPTMSYSSAWFSEGEKQSLAGAQRAKINRILQSLDTRPGDHILEIGCGWGGVMEEALRSNIAITGLTLSTEQKAYAEERLATIRSQIDNPPSFEVRLQDYRDCQEKFNGIASVEMFEAVGEKHWPEYFQAIAKCLKPGGKACIQTIVIAEELFDRYRHNTDFIQQYVFPGGMLPSRASFKESAAKAGLQIEGEFAFGADYAKTLCLWRDSFNQRLEEVRGLGFDEAFIRLWNFYLMYCAAGFAERNIDVVQFTLSHQQTSTSPDALQV
ncbi:cyclopropane-fatty-acyl-phospholipid synthase [Polynucleobacter wuianus]|uniref:Cyclopropane-fatty-acyl-phospholipid synthase n=1 Tax=Polynucleobacter wuianus TaxID=1743168 RepID=A0A191UHS3_9BURK|nr:MULTISPECIES: cyclopropane-fatty-acyl-phospholipid synthase family protein [Polynucleobacter]ANJ00554.1 cyclopropane-fatty-acyl-phospholipid synthase [Polynucleobacter wuianus]MBU3553146.1 class I SAM-dependent methyltransferase [Polynucleobacter sp. MWH-Post4-6-1]MBU3609823.1 class I SAM-dependent methyltransferase [Polynucleobacter wuianus]